MFLIPNPVSGQSSVRLTKVEVASYFVWEVVVVLAQGVGRNAQTGLITSALLESVPVL